jgi:hypothetical protein
MERRRAIAVAGSTALTALTVTVAVAANTGGGLLGFGGVEQAVGEPGPTTTEWVTTTTAPDVPLEPVVVTDVVYDDQYVVVPSSRPAATPAPPPASPPASTPTRTVTPSPAPSPPSSASPGPQGLPPGFRVPDDWPEGKPYPPIPEGCQRGVLEDDGRWSCEWDDEHHEEDDD